MIENYIEIALQIANNNQHGYCQGNRWGDDFDCSSFIITVLERAGIKVKTAGATNTRNIESIFTGQGFVRVPLEQRRRGDILNISAKHCAIYLGNNLIVHASLNELGKTTGGKPGDQTGKEIGIANYYRDNWVCLRYSGNALPIVNTAKQNYIVGKNYKVLVNLNVRTGAGAWYQKKCKADLTPNGKMNANASGSLMPNTVVTILDLKEEGQNLWGRIPSGWIALVHNGQTFVK